MHEIEVKARLKDKEAVMKALKALGAVFSPPMTEADDLYAKDVSSMEAYNRCSEFLRIRERGNGELIFTMKYHPERHEGRPDSMPIEHETAIGSKKAMEAILALQGYVPVVQVVKTREKGKHGKWEICVDEVEGLGSFIELEEMGDAGEAARIMEEMFAFFGTLGIAREDMLADRYDIALLKKRFAA